MCKGAIRDLRTKPDLAGAPLGEAVHRLARWYMETYSAEAFPQQLANGTLPRVEFVRHFAYMYAMVLWFNRLLASTIPACDVVTEQKLQRELIRQLIEEMRHNELYRKFLASLGVDHDHIYRIVQEELVLRHTEMGDWVEDLLMRTRTHGDAPAFYAQTTIPYEVLAMCHFLHGQLGDTDVPLTVKLAVLTSIELMLCEAVTFLFPGMRRYVRDLDAVRWFEEHTFAPDGMPPNKEQAHLDHGIARLNARGTDSEYREWPLDAADQVLRMFYYLLTQHEIYGRHFPIERFRIS